MGRTLSDMVLDFFEFDDVDDSTRTWRSDDEEEEGPDEISTAETKAFWESQHQLLQDALSRRSSAETRIQRATEEAIRKMQSFSGSVCTCLKECRKNCVLRHITDRLRDAGYDSALCKSKWRRSPEIPSGEHSYMDVLVESKKAKGRIRILIELNFRSEFEMARATSDYNSLVANLPEIFVGKAERLRNVIRIMCNAAKKSMKDNKMHMAPWRKPKYMVLKWFGGTCERVTPGLLLPNAAVERPMRPRASLLTFDLHCITAVEVL